MDQTPETASPTTAARLRQARRLQQSWPGGGDTRPVSCPPATPEVGVDLYLDQQHIDTTTPTGKLLFHITGAFAEIERSACFSRSRPRDTPRIV